MRTERVEQWVAWERRFALFLARESNNDVAHDAAHIQRVVANARKLASQENARLEIVIPAAWLHDCGKVTTPEYVVDKATKLETIYNRIHEVRMRFEVLLRDAEISYYRRRLQADGDAAFLKEALEEEKRGIVEDFAFVAACNVGGEFMAPGRWMCSRKNASTVG